MTIKQDFKVSIIAGVIYGVFAQLFARTGFFNEALLVMSFSYVIILPFCLGWIAVQVASEEERAQWVICVLRPIGVVALCMLIAFLVGWEGTICVIMAFPIYIPLAMLGGLIAHLVFKRAKKTNDKRFYAVLILPLMLGPIETSSLPLPKEIRQVHTEISLSASPEQIWPHIIRVRRIHEPQQGFFYQMGFPKPLEATLSHEGVGGVREAKFERGLTFFETVTEWDPLKKIKFTIQAHPDTVPLTTLDPHVVPGGAFFEALEGCYTIVPHPHDPRKSILKLSSQYRLSTHFNFYASWWSDWLMEEIQNNILNVIEQRVHM